MNSQSFSSEVRVATEVALKVGKEIYRLGRCPEKLTVSISADAPYGHSAAVTSADALSQKLILEHLRREFPQAHILTEEKPQGDDHHSDLVTLDTLSKISTGCTFGVDPIDGTSEFKNGLYEWALSIGVKQGGLHTGGVIYAPALCGGTIVAGERGKGVFVSEDGSDHQRVHISSRAIEDASIYLGCDFHWRVGFTAFEHAFAENVHRTKSVSSCAVGLAFVAAGKVDAIIQPVQRPWDWFAGYPLVEEAGGKFQFYRYNDERIAPLDRPDLDSYNPVTPNVAFIAGNPVVVDWLFDILCTHYGK